MKTLRHSFLLTMMLLIALVYPLGAKTSPSFAATANNPPPPPPMRVLRASFIGVSQPLRDIVPKQPALPEGAATFKEQPRLVLPKALRNPATPTSDLSILQDKPIGLAMPAPLANFAGVNNVSGVLPPDTQGDIGYDPATGKKYYVQWVNLAFKIWDVTNPAAPEPVYGPAAGNTLWSGSGTLCATNNDGDPITLFDHLANRWLMSQFALSFPNDFHQCIAISATADPTGVWYLYDFQTSTSLMNDYPKFGVWPDGYYMSVNQFNGSTLDWEGAGVAVFERSAMLQGLSARMIYLDLGAVTLDYGGMLPSDLDGPPPPVGTPNFFVEWDDSSWLGDPQDTLRLWEFHVDWNNPANTTFGANSNYDPNAFITTANVDPDMCNFNRNCIPQPGTTAKLDAISDRLMYRLQYRNFGSYQTLVSNHTVDVNGSNRAGIHWFELRKIGGTWTMYQQGSYSPDSSHRWMGSLAMDRAGNMALGYSLSSTSIYPSVRYSGRLSTDPLGILPQGETTLIAGGGAQTHSSSRWGDYSMMAVDPEDDCTFWYTQEYYQTTSDAGWQTRIGAFRFPNCTAQANGSLEGMVRDTSMQPLPGALISISGGYITNTDSNGHYSILLPPDTYEVTASKYGYLPSTATGVVVSPSSTTIQDFTLTEAPKYTLSGVVTDAQSGWPLYARIAIAGYPDSPIFTDAQTGAYSVELAEGAYTLEVRAMSGGYEPESMGLTINSHTTQDFALSPDLLACSAPGYMPIVSFVEDFETWPPSGWTIVNNAGTGGLVWNSNLSYGDSNYTGGAGLAADVNSDRNQYKRYNTELITPLIDPDTLVNLTLTYRANFQVYSGNEALDLDIKNVGDPTWTTISHWVENHGSLYSLPGETVTIDLTPYVTGDFQLRWHYYTSELTPWDWYAQVDEVKIGVDCALIPSAGLVVGAVYDANTAQPIETFTVEDAASNPALLIDASEDPSAPPRMYIIGEPAGSVSLTANAYRYDADTQSPTVVGGAVIRQDFTLPAAWFSVQPDSLQFILPYTHPVASLPLTLTNSGGRGAAFEVFTLAGLWPPKLPNGPFADHTRHLGPKNLNDPDASKLRVNLTPTVVSPLAAGNVIASWLTGLAYAWGIGFNTHANDLWLGNILIGGGDNLNYRFLTNGSNTGDTIDTNAWVSMFAADMAYIPFSGNLWQVNVGGDNCVYELDPQLEISTGRKVCPAFGTSERGLAYDPLTDTFFAGSWNDGIINRFDAKGTLLESVSVNLSISGLAYNPVTAHLFVMTNHEVTPAYYDVYVLDVNHGYSLLGAFNIQQGSTKVFEDYSQAGLEMDCNGNLWAVNQNTQRVYVAESGESGICNWQVPWLTSVPGSGYLSAPGQEVLSIQVDASGLPFAPYHAYLRISGETPYDDLIVPIFVNFSGLYQLFIPVVGR